VLATGGGWMIAGMLLYVAYRRYKGLPLRETVAERFGRMPE